MLIKWMFLFDFLSPIHCILHVINFIEEVVLFFQLLILTTEFFKLTLFSHWVFLLINEVWLSLFKLMDHSDSFILPSLFAYYLFFIETLFLLNLLLEFTDLEFLGCKTVLVFFLFLDQLSKLGGNYDKFLFPVFG